MDETYVLTDEYNNCSIVVKKQFQPSDTTKFHVWLAEGITKFIHNTTGPAFTIRNQNGEVVLEQWWLNGNILTGEEKEKMKHKVKFESRIEDFLD